MDDQSELVAIMLARFRRVRYFMDTNYSWTPGKTVFRSFATPKTPAYWLR